KASFKKALYSENVFVVAPYDLALAYAEVAFDNGVNFRLEEKVVDIRTSSKGFRVTTNKNKFTCKIVINTIPNEIYLEENNIKTQLKNNYFKNMQYLVVDDSSSNILSTVVTNAPSEDFFAINIPTLSGGALMGVRHNDKLNLQESVELANTIALDLEDKEISNIFHENYDKDEVVIDDREMSKGYISVTGKHYGKITMAPAIAKNLAEFLEENMNIKLKKHFIDKRREMYRFRDLSKKEINEIIKLDKRYGKIVCICNNISEGEIIDSIRRPLGARTVEGVKRRTGAGFGTCNGSYCIGKIINILAHEMDKKETDIVVDSKNSKVLAARIKEFNEV
ncbi:MAG: FAD-dependent oxidoreductase, partial [Clostridium sp.]